MRDADLPAHEPASIAKRSVAVMIDSAALLALTVPALLFLYGPQYVDPEYLSLLPGYRGFIAWAVILPSSALLLCWLAWRRTPGTALLGLSIVDRNSKAKPRAFAFLKRLAGCYLCIASGGLGFLLAAFNTHRQGLHDRLANTLVVGPAAPTPAPAPFQDSSRWLPWFTAILSAALGIGVFYSPIGTGDGGGVIGYSIYRGLLLMLAHLPLAATGIVIAIAMGLDSRAKRGLPRALPGIAANSAALAGVLLMPTLYWVGIALVGWT
jgi:uncharacterized RDD family membrane protein YckC